MKPASETNNPKLQWTDNHTHFCMLKDRTADQAIEEAKALGVHRFINIGTNENDLLKVLSFAQKHSGTVFCTLGVHPHDAKNYKNCIGFIADNIKAKEVVAVGEIGLDYFYENSDREIQKEAFEYFLQLAIDENLPVEIHTRDAEEDTVAMLKNFGGKIKGVIHCFTGTQYLADECLKLGMNFSISGIITFNKAQELRDVVKTIPLDRLHVETDAPFLAPSPHRGKENYSGYVLHTAEKLAEIKGVSLKELNTQTEKNSDSLFFSRWG